MMEPIPNWDMEVGNMAVIENVPLGGAFKGLFIMEDPLLKPFDLFHKVMVVHCGLGLLFGNHAKETISNHLEEDGVDVGVVLKGDVDCAGQHSQWCQHKWLRDWKWCQRFSRQDI